MILTIIEIDHIRSVVSHWQYRLERSLMRLMSNTPFRMSPGITTVDLPNGNDQNLGHKEKYEDKFLLRFHFWRLRLPTSKWPLAITEC